MAADVIHGFSKNHGLFEAFQTNPIKAIADLEKKTKLSFDNVRLSDLKVIMQLNTDELDLLSKIYSKSKGNKTTIKLSK